MSQIPEDLREMFESSKLDTTMFVGSQIRTLIMSIARLEAENARLKAPVGDKDVNSLYMILASLHEDVDPPTREDIRLAINAMISARAQEPLEESTQPKGKK